MYALQMWKQSQTNGYGMSFSEGQTMTKHPLKRYTKEEVATWALDQEWLKAEEAIDQIRQMEREISLMFSPREMLDAVEARDAAQKLAISYEKALRTIALASGRFFQGAKDVQALPSLVDHITECLAIANSRKQRRN
jgi:hypothetical protein